MAHGDNLGAGVETAALFKGRLPAGGEGIGRIGNVEAFPLFFQHPQVLGLDDEELFLRDQLHRSWGIGRNLPVLIDRHD